MKATGRQGVEALLRAHYRAERGEPDEALKAAAKAAVRKEVARTSSVKDETSAVASSMTFAGFVAVQARFIHPRVWAAQLALVAAMVALCLQGDEAMRGLPLVSGVLAATTVLVGLPDLLASSTHRVAELEYSCRFDCRSVALARLIVLGCSDVAVVTAIALAAPLALGADAFASFVHVCVPYFLSCAGALAVVRRCPPSQAMPLACLWALLVMAAAYAVFSLAPHAYAQASGWAWTLVATGSLAWTVREVRTWLGCISSGLDTLAPHSTSR